MSKSPSDTSVKKAISQVIADFQANPERFWNERDMHWSLFYYLKQEQVSKEAYPTELIRAELPTLKLFPGERPARGHYDLAILDAKSYSDPLLQNMEACATWQEYLNPLKITVALEIKLWLYRLKSDNMKERVDWDIKKLTDKPNNIQNAYFLNFVQLDFKRDIYEAYYQQLRDYLLKQKKQFPKLNILCAPSDSQVHSNKANWL